jgi:hypothetical protein
LFNLSVYDKVVGVFVIVRFSLRRFRIGTHILKLRWIRPPKQRRTNSELAELTGLIHHPTKASRLFQ